MNCGTAKELINESLEVELTAVESADLSAHLKSCAKCEAERKAFHSLHNLLLGDEFLSPSADFTKSVMARIENSRAREVYLERRNLRVAATVSAAAVIIAVLLVPTLVDTGAVYENASALWAAFEPFKPSALAIDPDSMVEEARGMVDMIERARPEEGYPWGVPATILVVLTVLGAAALAGEVAYIAYNRRRGL